ncbi:MAG: TAT-variant-translocated molybdopterin oxidoreductase [Chloroherpetonaceae bacterium]|nr:TAT-variant-translocated molybdopterin oxidoreductase [Chloroherpetonaceae bacterium]
MKRTPRPKIDQPLTGKRYWRSLEEEVNTPEFQEWVEREFPEGAIEMSDPISRRKFLTIMGASFLLAGLASCRRPVEKIVPYVKAPEDITPGIPQYYATTMPFGLSALGILVRSHEGRPNKIEGNERHPSSLGATNAFAQAEILNLYDPDRSQVVKHLGEKSSWQAFTEFWRNELLRQKSQNGRGLAILTESFASPSLARLMNECLKTFPEAKVVAYEPVSDENIYEGVRLATGEVLRPLYDFRAAKVILSLNADFLLKESESVANARAFAEGRRVASEKDSMNRLYVVEAAYSVTGAMADHRLRLQARKIGAFAAALAEELQRQGVAIPGTETLQAPSEDFDKKWIEALARDLIQHKGESLVVAGREQPAAVHALAIAINAALGNLGNTLSFVPFKDAALPSRSELVELVKAMHEGKIETLVMLGGNPVYNAPADLDFASALKKVKTSIHLSYHDDETSALSTWHLPKSHFLESWGDARAADGTASLIQPLIAPLFDTRSVIEVLNLLTTGIDGKGYALVQETWKQQTGLSGIAFEDFWRKSLHDGVIENSASQKLVPSLKAQSLAQLFAQKPFEVAARENTLELCFQPSTATFDGRYANNAWLQETPEAITKICWDNAALMSQGTAKQLGLKHKFALSETHREVIALRLGNRQVELPVWVVPGHADGSITVALGYGRTRVGRVGNSVGANTYAIRTSDAMDVCSGVEVIKTGKTMLVASTQYYGYMDGRAIVIEGTLAEYREKPDFVESHLTKYPPSKLYDSPYKYDQGHQWGMTIDLNACIGCNACVVACQSENNVPVVGKEQTAKGRHMHWIRIDRYFVGEGDMPEMVYQPVACQHCENAPCEQVCPVVATVHDQEGLNTMVYNRCIGTRYCANNCPYKVRRFNYFNYQNDNVVWNREIPEITKMAMNPEVTVRSRGVMEKCTYCVHRIQTTKILAKNEGRDVVDGEIMTACQQVCPTQAIVFGDIRDPNSKVSQIKAQNRNYALLGELNVKPRTTYLAKLRNPNPELEQQKA